MFPATWATLAKRLAFLAGESDARKTQAVHFEVDGHLVPVDKITLETREGGQVAIILETRAKPLNPTRPRLGVGRTRKAKRDAAAV